MKEEIIKLYLQGLCTREIASLLKIGKTTVGNIVKGAGISRPRKIRNSVLESKVKKVPVLKTGMISYLDGLVISDGHLRQTRKVVHTSAFTQNSVVPAWLELIKNEFFKWGIESRVRPEKRKRGSKGWIIQTESNDQFYEQRVRWYVNGFKIIPRDIDFGDCNLLRNWLYGDGTRVKTTLRFCTDDFLIDDIEFAQDRLKYVWGYQFTIISMGRNKKGASKYRLSLGKRAGLYEFLRQIGNPEGLFSYKFREI